MAMPVVTVASGGMPVVDAALITPTPLTGRGVPVSEAPAGKGVAVTKVAAGATPGPGMLVTYVTIPPSP